MIRHVTVLTFDDTTGADDVAAIAEALRTMATSIAPLRSYVVGTDLGIDEGNADLVAVADFDDVGGYVEYRDDAEHQRIIAEMIRPRLSARSALQHEH